MLVVSAVSCSCACSALASFTGAKVATSVSSVVSSVSNVITAVPMGTSVSREIRNSFTTPSKSDGTSVVTLSETTSIKGS